MRTILLTLVFVLFASISCGDDLIVNCSEGGWTPDGHVIKHGEKRNYAYDMDKILIQWGKVISRDCLAKGPRGEYVFFTYSESGNGDRYYRGRYPKDDQETIDWLKKHKFDVPMELIEHRVKIDKTNTSVDASSETQAVREPTKEYTPRCN